MCDCHNEAVAWAWVRPADPSILDSRPLLDLGTGDGQTLATLVRHAGLIVGVDRSPEILAVGRPAVFPVVSAEAVALPFAAGTFETVLAGDLFHHLDETALEEVLTEVRRVLRPGGRLVAWWYEAPGREAPDAPRFPRPYGVVASAASAFVAVDRLALVMTLEPAPPTVGLVAKR